MKSVLFLTVLFLIFSSSNLKNDLGTEIEISENSENPTVSCELIDSWKRAKIFTKQYLEAMPEQHYNFQPTPEILPFADEFLHVACVNFRYAAMIAGGNDCANYDDVYKNPNLQSKESVIAFVMDSYDAMIDRLNEESNLNEETYYYRWSCSKECLSIKGFEHQSHHRGKAAIYLRLKGITPPGHMLIEDWTMPKDITEQGWIESDEYVNYQRLVDKE